MKYRKRPVVIEAFQYSLGLKYIDIPEWAQKAYKEGVIYPAPESTGELYIKTLEGDRRASIGDYIIQGVKGELYPCKPDIFELTYETADDTDILVEKNNCLMREVNADTAEVFEVVAADYNVFVIAPVAYCEENKSYMTDYDKLQAYSNEPKINSLQALGFKKLEK